jgi:hypothetical protein
MLSIHLQEKAPRISSSYLYIYRHTRLLFICRRKHHESAVPICIYIDTLVCLLWLYLLRVVPDYYTRQCKSLFELSVFTNEINLSVKISVNIVFPVNIF